MATREGRATRREGRSSIRPSRDQSHSVYEEEENSHCGASHDQEAGDMKHNAAIKERQQDLLRARNTDSHALVSFHILSHLAFHNVLFQASGKKIQNTHLSVYLLHFIYLCQ